MQSNLKLKKCECGTEFKQYNSLQKYCSWKCDKLNSKTPRILLKKPIAKVSKKQNGLNKIYSKLRVEFLSLPENKICFIESCNKIADTIEHRAGRGINFLNTTTWAACCLQHNLELENNSEMSKKYQLSKIHGGKKL